ncbi:MAG: response regulator [Pseudomonadota bacterium]
MPKQVIRVLLVEDDIVDRMACRRLFSRSEDYDFALSEAETGREGLDLIRTQELDCVLLDYHLPDMNGLEFLQAMLDQNGEASVPVMMLTGEDSAAVAAEVMRQGARDYLGKGADRHYLELLPAAIQRMLREQRMLDEKRQAEAKFRTLLEQIQAITYICTLGESASVYYISPQIRMLGFSPDTWLDDPELHARQIHPDDRGYALPAIANSRVTGSPLRCEYRLISGLGKVLWFRDEAEAVLDEAGRKLFLQGILVDITQNKLAQQALQKSQEALRQLAAHQDRIKEGERKRIAQEIHDELGGLLTGIKAYVSVSIDRTAQAGGPADQLLLDASDLVDTAMEAVRKVITDLRPSVLDQLGVWEALEWHADQIASRSGLACTCSIDAQARALEMGPERSTMLFRIVQETLTNVVRHAKAAHVAIRVNARDGKIVVEIEDDGVGIKTERLLNQESWGILGMVERARHFGGELTITGKPGVGTTMTLRLPLESADES